MNMLIKGFVNIDYKSNLAEKCLFEALCALEERKNTNNS